MILICSAFCASSISVNDGKLDISVSMVDSSNIKFTLKVDSGDWVGIGFGDDMNNHDMFYVSDGNFYDCYATGESTPTTDSDQADYTFTGSSGTYEIS